MCLQLAYGFESPQSQYLSLGKLDCAVQNWDALFLVQVGSPFLRQPADLSSEIIRLMPNVMWKTHWADWNPRLIGTHPPLENLGWQAWLTTPSFVLRGGQKLPMVTAFLVMREGYWNSFQWVNAIPWIDLAGEDTTAVNTQLVLLPLWKKWGETYRCDLMSSCWAHESEPHPSGGISPLQRSNSFSSQFCSSVVIKCPHTGKNEVWDRSFKKEAGLQTFVCIGADLTGCCWGLFENLSLVTGFIPSAGWK